MRHSFKDRVAGLAVVLAVVLSFASTLALPGCSVAAEAGSAASLSEATPTLREFAGRMRAGEADEKSLIAAAEKAADRNIVNPLMLIDVPYGLQGWFAEELVNRAGGLANALPPEERKKAVTPQDVVLLGVRSWEVDGPKMAKAAAEFQATGAMVVMFASRVGAPADLKADVIIDNHAPGAGKEHTVVNAVVNIANAWMWCAEYAGAMTRRGQHPPVMLSIFMPQGEAHNKQYAGSNRVKIYPVEKKIGAGAMARAYRARVDKAVADLASGPTRRAIGEAGKVIADTLASGGKVHVATCTHFLLNELNVDGRTPMKPLRVVWKSATAMKDVGANDLVLWLGYYGMSTPYEDYGGMFRKANVRLIRSFAGAGSEADQADKPLLHIPQTWEMPDAELDVPFPPGRMAPVSGVIQGLTWRMIEDEVLRQMPASGATTQPSR